MNENARPLPDLSDELRKYVRETVGSSVREAVPAVVATEEERRFSQFKWIVALIGLVGLGTFGTLSNYLIEKAVDGRLEARTGNISDALDFIRFNSIALKLDLGASFSVEDRTSILNYLRRSAKNDRVRYSAEFNAALVQVMKSFTEAGQSSSINEILQLYEREILTSDTLVEILVHHYGQEIVGRHSTPKDDQSMKTFEKLEAIAEGAKVGELALAYRILYVHKASPKSVQPAVLQALDRAQTLATDDLARFFREILQRTIAVNWQRVADPQGLSFQSITRSFFERYASSISTRTGVAEASLRRISEVGSKTEDARQLASQLAAGVKNLK